MEEAVVALGTGNTMIYAGGTDLIGTLRFDVLPDNLYPLTIVSLKGISPSLDYIKEEGGILKIGALTRLADIATSDIIKKRVGSSSPSSFQDSIATYPRNGNNWREHLSV
jgi:CO/xanthine dehydrogenase FAD-binding subunit